MLAPPSSVSGRIGGRCDADYFAITHEGGPLVATLGALDGGACAVSSASLALVGPSGEVVASGAPDGSDCARLEHSADASELLLRVDADPEAPDFQYELTIE